MSLNRAAEQVVIGAILLQPAQFDEVREWLTSADFEGIAEREAFQAICDLNETNEPVSPAAVERRLRASSQQGPVLADASFVVTCMQRCPEPGRAPVYGRMVLELSIRRHVAERAVGLRQRAGAASTADELNRVFAEVDSVRRDVERLHLREALAARSKSPTPLIVAELQPLLRKVTGGEYQLEVRTVRALAGQPATLDTVNGWLKPADFADGTCAGLYGELQLMRAASNPIDTVTLAWRAERVGLRGPACDALLARSAPEFASADPLALSRRVLESSVQAAVLGTAESLQALGQSSQQNATAVAYTRLNNLWPRQRRLVRARLTSS